MDNNSLKDILLITKKYGKKIVLYTIIAGILTGIASLFMPNYYKASTVFYPGNLLLASPNPVGYGDKERYPFGNGDDLDRLFAVGQSNEMIDHLIEKFDLAAHFDIKNNSPEQKHKIVEVFKKNYNISKNKYEAVELSFEDKDREMASKIVNEAREYIANKIGTMVNGSSTNTTKAFVGALQQQEKLSTQLADSIKFLKNKYNIIQSVSQGTELSELLVSTENELNGSRAKVEFYTSKPKYIDSLIKYQAFVKSYESQNSKLKKQGASFVSIVNEIYKLEVEYEKMITQIAIDKERLKGLVAMNESQFSAIHTIDEAQPPLRKSRPIRSIMVIGAMAAVGFFMLISLVILESIWFQELIKGQKSAQ
jgi:tyrosine-protein kinase Etk/Wzc